jgi:ABC-type dipeptide/oligopeptide/nickel transport system permease subunit
MPPTTKPQTKKKEAEKGKAKKAVAVAAALLLLVLAVFVEAQQQQGAGVTAEQALGGFRDFLKQVVLGVRLAIAMAFWAAISIIVAHFAIGKISPTRFQRMGAFWDGLERAKDIVYGFAWLFLLIFAIYAAIGIIANGGSMDLNTFGTVVKWIMVDPITDLFNYLRQ